MSILPVDIRRGDAGSIFALVPLELSGSRFVDAYHRALLGLSGD
jgi:hypothetical protein